MLKEDFAKDLKKCVTSVLDSYKEKTKLLNDPDSLIRSRLKMASGATDTQMKAAEEKAAKDFANFEKVNSLTDWGASITEIAFATASLFFLICPERIEDFIEVHLQTVEKKMSLQKDKHSPFPQKDSMN